MELIEVMALVLMACGILIIGLSTVNQFETVIGVIVLLTAYHIWVLPPISEKVKKKTVGDEVKQL